ncbi:MAG TPA: hypothetical protein PLP61_08265 [Nocardioides sp.]|uniref:hypothetical protein n=1 Tax=Nocardioides sp. TaxID=35761 RepID=UPI002C9EBAA9|nr:hypothetical protein [Nocardioides sp.]HQR27016.1 hypothetical protein [Nocardioides sp.]
MSRRVGYAALWALAVGLAIAVGLVAVSTVGAGIRGRGPLGTTVGLDEPNPTPRIDPDAPVRTREVSDFWGSFRVRCQDGFATGVRAAAAPGWKVVSYEEGPDDDVDAVFSRAARSVDLEVFCNRGEPTVGDLEINTLPDEG